MKKFLTAISLAAAATVASANPVGFISYDNGSHNSKSLQELTLGVAQQGSWGLWDLSALHQRVEFTSKSASADGIELGLTKAAQVGPFTLKGRLGVGYVNGEKDDAGFYTAAVEAQLPLTKRVGLYTNYRHRDTFGSGNDWNSNRSSAGLDVAVTDATSLRVGFVSTKQQGVRYDGGTLTLAHQF